MAHKKITCRHYAASGLLSKRGGGNHAPSVQGIVQKRPVHKECILQNRRRPFGHVDQDKWRASQNIVARRTVRQDRAIDRAGRRARRRYSGDN